MKETWRQVDGFDGYYVSSEGRAKSTKGKEDKILKLTNRRGYLIVNMSTSIEGKKVTKQDSIQSLVLRAFVGSPSEGQRAKHIDGNKEDNRVLNLKWVSHRECFKSSGEKDPLWRDVDPKDRKPSKVASLKKDDVVDILKSSDSQANLAKKYGVSHITIHRIRKGLSWKWLYESVKKELEHA